MECFEILSKVFRNEVKVVGKGLNSYINEYINLPISISYFIEEHDFEASSVILTSQCNLISSALCRKDECFLILND